MKRCRFAVGTETFEKISDKGFVYVHKTGYMQNLIADSCLYFLNRPYRFVKSVLLSIIKAFNL